MIKYILVLLILLTLSGCGKEYYTTRWEVVEVVQCLGEDNYSAVCSIKARKGDVIRAGRVKSFAYVGESVYKVCWEQEDGGRCYTDFMSREDSSYY